VGPAPLALAVLGQIGARRDADLARRPLHNLLRDARRVLQEPAEIAHRPELHCEPKTVDITPASRDLALVIVAEAEATGELVSRELTRELAVLLRARRDARRELQHPPIGSQGPSSKLSTAARRSVSKGRL
jgi:hypothetical protein